jgi:hypothetical protein
MGTVSNLEERLSERLRKLFAENKTGIEIHFMDGHIISVEPDQGVVVEVGLDYIALNPKRDDGSPCIIPFNSIKIVVIAVQK